MFLKNYFLILHIGLSAVDSDFTLGMCFLGIIRKWNLEAGLISRNAIKFSSLKKLIKYNFNFYENPYELPQKVFRWRFFY